jgi:(E)-4-hydroxy-3-methylbut-2-enyl-diphosphate synthase
MTTTDTLDTDATVAQTLRLAAVGCEIVRITAPTAEDARNLGRIRDALRARGCAVPLVADIHFSPAAALEAAKHVEKVRINPGNFADSKRFAIREYSDAEYDAEVDRIAQRFGPLVEVCKSRGVAMRIGTNHGSLSDRIMNRYGDTPHGMVESAVEFAGICRAHDYHDVIFSMKSSNPKVMVQAYRLLAHRLDELGWDYPFHLGVTEAGNGQDGRIKSAIGIGALLDDGIGDTIRVSLTEDPEAEIPVAFALARRFETRAPMPAVTPRLVEKPSPSKTLSDMGSYVRHDTRPIMIGEVVIGGTAVPATILDWKSDTHLLSVDDADKTRAREAVTELVARLVAISQTDHEAYPRVDAIAIEIETDAQVAVLHELRRAVETQPVSGCKPVAMIAGVGANVCVANVAREADALVVGVATLVDAQRWRELADARRPLLLEVEVDAIGTVATSIDALRRAVADARCLGVRDLAIVVRSSGPGELVRAARAVRNALPEAAPPIWLRHESNEAPDELLLAASVGLGSALCDGIGDAVSIGGVDILGDLARTRLTYDILQGASARISKTEYVACPSCGRTLFDLQDTTSRIQSRTSHLKGVKIAIMGCIVNGPGEMADADFGYVGGAPEKVNLYVGRECVEKGVPQAQADERLIDLIRRHNRWIDPPHVHSR